jgi:hypothetical protein
MIVELNPQNNFRTTVPIYLKVKNFNLPVIVEVKPIGEIAFSIKDKILSTHFWVDKSGNYELKIQDKNSIWSKEIHIEKQQFINFTNQFGFFSILFLILITGLILWMKNHLRKNSL